MRCLIFGILLLSVFFSAESTLAQSEQVVYATAQQFERGLMIWRSDTSFIWVLGDNGAALSFPASAYSTLPDNPITTAADGSPARLRPIFGMGKVWGNNAGVRELIGWPVLPEVGWSMPVRRDGATTFLTRLDDTVIQINGDGTWHTFTNPNPARIWNVTVTPNPVRFGEKYRLSWQGSGAAMAIIEVYDTSNNVQYAMFPDMPISGSADIPVPEIGSWQKSIVVWAANKVTDANGSFVRYDKLAQSSTILNITSANEGQSDSRAFVTYADAAFQYYERGFMVWRADTGGIYVFYNDLNGGTFSHWDQATYQGWPDNTIVPPTGYVTPIFGFGKVWGNRVEVRYGLGNAVAPEQAYTASLLMQYGELVWLTIPDGRVVQLLDPYMWATY
jgi:hypothetical protein